MAHFFGRTYKRKANINTYTIIYILWGRGGRGGGKCFRRPQNEQICLLHNANFNETVPKAADLIFA